MIKKLENMWKLVNDTFETYRNVNMKIQPMSYFPEGNNTFVHRNSNTLPSKHDIEGVFGRIFTT